MHVGPIVAFGVGKNRSYRLSVNVEYAVRGLVLSFPCGNGSYFLSFLVCETPPSDVRRTVAD